MKKFEYISYKRDLSNDQLNDLGNYGWELISHTVAINNRMAAEYYIFKRELS